MSRDNRVFHVQAMVRIWDNEGYEVLGFRTNSTCITTLGESDQRVLNYQVGKAAAEAATWAANEAMGEVCESCGKRK